jgi:phenylalanyl-tRNA synthetase beta chain
MLCAVFAHDDDDATTALAAWHVVEAAFRVSGVRLLAPGAVSATSAAPLPGLHPTRSARLVAPGGVTLGTVGEIDPGVALSFGLTRTTVGGTSARRVGWLEIELGPLFDETAVPRRATVGGAVSRYPSSDIDLALVVEDRHPADAVAEALRQAGGSLLESVRLFDVYRGAGIPAGRRSLAFRLRFCSPEGTLTDEEVGALRTRCIDAAAEAFGAVLR